MSRPLCTYVDALLDACMPQGTQIQQLRTITKENVIDVLYYTSSAHAQAIIDAVAGQLTAKWETFASERGGACLGAGEQAVDAHAREFGAAALDGQDEARLGRLPEHRAKPHVGLELDDTHEAVEGECSLDSGSFEEQEREEEERRAVQGYTAFHKPLHALPARSFRATFRSRRATRPLTGQSSHTTTI